MTNTNPSEERIDANLIFDAINTGIGLAGLKIALDNKNPPPPPPPPPPPTGDES